MRIIVKTGVFASVALLAGCQTWGPTWSEVTGARYNIPALNEGPTIINQLDGLSPGTAPGEAVKMAPGRHTLILQVVPPPSVTGLVDMEKTTLDVAPCTRYYINGRFDAATSTAWRPFIDKEERIPGCQLPAATK